MTDGFKGRIGRTLRESTPWWPAPTEPSAGAPNVVFIVLDDVGFADLGCYGSEIETPRMDALASGGLRFNNFHVTSLCSPTRACLLTGRNAHTAGVGAISEWTNGFPGYEGRIARHTATAAEMFAEHGYGTYAIGKWHLCNLANYAVAGPHADWPLGRGFCRWYGFLGGYVDHWNPDLHEDNHPIRHAPREDYHLSEDLVEHAIEHVRDHVTSARGRPFVLYLAFGAAHWPLHVPAEYLRHYRGRYAQGWDAVREQRFVKQRRLGIVPASAQLAPRNPGVPPWVELTREAQLAGARLQEAYAGFVHHTDTQIGRVVDYLASIGQLDNTVVVLLSDNGASGEGGETGALNIRKHLQTERETSEYVLAHLDRIGSEYSFPQYPQGWAQVSNTPLKWYKKHMHGGGIRAPLIMHWPRGIAARGEVRTQYHHVIDVLPTLLEVTGVQAPQVYRGVPQTPVQGVSMAYTFGDPHAPSRRHLQYYEIVGNRALYDDGWKIVAQHAKGADYDSDSWELYRVEDDFSEIEDLASQHPERVSAMVAAWWREAERCGVLPLDDRESERALDWFRMNAPTRYEYLPNAARADRLLVPAINGCNWQIVADVVLDVPRTEGAILALGNRFGGLALYCHAGEVCFDYVYSEARTDALRLPQPTGRQRLRVTLERSDERAGTFTLSIDGQAETASVSVAHLWTTYGITAGLTCGYVNVPVVPSCPPPATFTAMLERVVLRLDQSDEPQAKAFDALLEEE